LAAMTVTAKIALAAFAALTVLRGATADDDAATTTAALVPECDAEKEDDCPGDKKCAVGGSGWAQCVDCTPEQFQLDCPYWWDADLIASANELCGLTCVGHRGSQCVSIDCEAGKALECVSSGDDWAQCVDCADEAFQADCGSWSDELAAAAEKKCKVNCASRTEMRGEGEETTTAAPVIQCDAEKEESGCPAPLVCAAGSDGWAQCVNCTAAQFLLDCPYWDAEVIASANTACSLTCVGHRNSQCVSIDCGEAQGLTCVSASDTWAQCVACTGEAYQADCGYWSDEMAAAAAAKCETECHSRTRLL